MSSDLSKYAGWVLGKRPSWKLPSQVEAIHYHHNRLKIPNTNTQIPNNIQIRNSNDPNILVSCLLFDGRFVF
jgi:hypothetical protein